MGAVGTVRHFTVNDRLGAAARRGKGLLGASSGRPRGGKRRAGVRTPRAPSGRPAGPKRPDFGRSPARHGRPGAENFPATAKLPASGVDSRGEIDENVRVRATAVLVGIRQPVDRRSVLDQTDEYLVAQVRAGEDSAFEAIYDRYARGLLAFCVQMLGSREAGEDALQLTFVAAYRALCRGDNDISLRPWLYTIARNRCLSELRTRRDAISSDGSTMDRQGLEGLADQVQRREELREMLDDMQRLPTDQRAALVLFELGDHSHSDIAVLLGVRREKVKALIFQAREALVRSRQARGRPCEAIREQLASLQASVLPRSVTRAHIDRCPSCAAFEDEVRRQRVALALILPVALTGELKALVLGSALSGGGAVAAGAGAGAGACGSGGGAVAAGAGACGSGATAAGATAAGGATVAGGA